MVLSHATSSITAVTPQHVTPSPQDSWENPRYYRRPHYHAASYPTANLSLVILVSEYQSADLALAILQLLLPGHQSGTRVDDIISPEFG